MDVIKDLYLRHDAALKAKDLEYFARITTLETQVLGTYSVLVTQLNEKLRRTEAELASVKTATREWYKYQFIGRIRFLARNFSCMDNGCLLTVNFHFIKTFSKNF